MPAIFHGLGTADHWVRPRLQNGGVLLEDEIPGEAPSSPPDGGGANSMPWLYLGTSVLSPLVDADEVTIPVLCDLNAPVPLNEIYLGETHTVETHCNRLNYVTFNRLRSHGFPGRAGLRRIDPVKKLGQWIRNVTDWELLLKWNPTSPVPIPADNSTPQGRMYYSAKLRHYRETTENNRVLEASLLFDCIPLFHKTTQTLELFTEFPADWEPLPAPE